MPVIDAIDEKKYGRLLAKYTPGVIRSDGEHDRLAGLLMKLALAEDRTAEEDRLIELLERLVDDYDEQRMQGHRQAGCGRWIWWIALVRSRWYPP